MKGIRLPFCSSTGLTDFVAWYTAVTERSVVAASLHASLCGGGDEASNARTAYRLLSLSKRLAVS
jgi:hypothetical protein